MSKRLCLFLLCVGTPIFSIIGVMLLGFAGLSLKESVTMLLRGEVIGVLPFACFIIFVALAALAFGAWGYFTKTVLLKRT